MLIGHQDDISIPPGTVKRWNQSPLEAHFDKKYFWDRGLIDDDEIIEALKQMLTRPNQPLESTHQYNVATISQYLLEIFHENSIFSIIDDGVLSIRHIYGSIFALPSADEETYSDIFIEIRAEDRHGSAPLKHTIINIGIICYLVTSIEMHEYDLDIGMKTLFFFNQL